MTEILDIVNLYDEVVSQATRDEVYAKSLCHRIVHVLIFDDDGKMALQKRSQTVTFCPGYWSTAVGGHVQSGENYEQAALREFAEELGTSCDIVFFSKDLYEAKGSPVKFVTAFKAIYTGAFNPNPDDVETIDFFSLHEVQAMIERGEKFHPELLFLLNKYFI